MANITDEERRIPYSLEKDEAPHIKLNQWMKLQSTDAQTRFSMLQVLGLIFEEEQARGRGYTKSQIGVALNIWADQVETLLDQLRAQEFIYLERRPFGMDLFGRPRNIHVYHITEVGRFYVNHLDTQFPGVWTTDNFRKCDI